MKKILIVDDQATVRKTLEMFLNRLGFFDIIQADDGTVALDLIKNRSDIDLIIADIHMKQMSGMELLEAVRMDPNFKHIPFLLLTRDSDMQTVSKAVQFTVDDYILKPFNLECIKRKLKKLGFLTSEA